MISGVSSPWLDAYGWHEAERRLIRLPNFSTEIDGERIHFAALEEPELMPADLRAFVATVSGKRP